MDDVKILTTREDVTEHHLELAESVFDGWFADAGRIDWEEFADRLVDPDGLAGAPFDIESYDTGAFRKIKAYVREYKNS